MYENFTEAPSGAVHNTRKYHKRITKTDKTEPLGVQYLTFLPNRPDDVKVFSTKAQLFDFIEYHVRYDGFQWDDFQMFKQINQKLIS